MAPNATDRAVAGPSARKAKHWAGQLRTDPLGVARALTTEYGPIVAWQAFEENLLLISDPLAVDHVLQKQHRNYSHDSFPYPVLAEFIGSHVASQDGPLWRASRRSLAAAFAPGTLPEVLGPSRAAVSRAASIWLAEPDSTMEAVPLMHDVSRDVLAELLIADDVSAARAVIDAVDAGLRDVTAHTLAQFPDPLRQRRIHRARQNLHDLLLPHMQRRLDVAATRLDAAAERTPVRGIQADPLQNAPDVLDSLVHAALTHDLSREQIINELLGVVILAHNSVGAALSWCLALLAADLGHGGTLQDQLAEEWAREVTGPVSLAQLAHLQLAKACGHEALRMFPPQWLISRRANHDDLIPSHQGNIAVPSGTLLVICPSLLNNHPDRFAHPEAFRPQRFIQHPELIQDCLTFGIGPRQCLGKQFALTIITVVLAQLIAQHRVLPTEPGLPRPQVGFVQPPDSSVRLQLVKR